MSENHLESALEENRNTNQMLFALAASGQRQAQLRSLEAQRQAQLQSIEAQRQAQTQLVATEQGRLELERQRLALETSRVEAAQAEAQAVKLLRRLLADVGSDLEMIRRNSSAT